MTEKTKEDCEWELLEVYRELFEVNQREKQAYQKCAYWAQKCGQKDLDIEKLKYEQTVANNFRDLCNEYKEENQKLRDRINEMQVDHANDLFEINRKESVIVSLQEGNQKLRDYVEFLKEGIKENVDKFNSNLTFLQSTACFDALRKLID
jgi:hypothetical protein